MDLFKKHVINDFANQYMNGKTPNPCVKCNSIIKWDALMNFAAEIGFEYIATGHYAQIEEKKASICELQDRMEEAKRKHIGEIEEAEEKEK